MSQAFMGYRHRSMLCYAFVRICGMASVSKDLKDRAENEASVFGSCSRELETPSIVTSPPASYQSTWGL